MATPASGTPPGLRPEAHLSLQAWRSLSTTSPTAGSWTSCVGAPGACSQTSRTRPPRSSSPSPGGSRVWAVLATAHGFSEACGFPTRGACAPCRADTATSWASGRRPCCLRPAGWAPAAKVPPPPWGDSAGGRGVLASMTAAPSRPSLLQRLTLALVLLRCGVGRRGQAQAASARSVGVRGRGPVHVRGAQALALAFSGASAEASASP